MKLTVAIPTHNRHRTLGLTLDSLAALKLAPEIELECLVIDNNSTDATPEVVESFARTAPFTVRRVFEPRQGSSFARNRAVQEANGEMLFFIDDDVIVEPDWAEQLLAEIGRRGLDAACGLVLAQWQAPPPPWLGAEVYGKLAVHRGSQSDAAAAEKLSQFSAPTSDSRGNASRASDCSGKTSAWWATIPCRARTRSYSRELSAAAAGSESRPAPWCII